MPSTSSQLPLNFPTTSSQLPHSCGPNCEGSPRKSCPLPCRRRSNCPPRPPPKKSTSNKSWLPASWTEWPCWPRPVLLRLVRLCCLVLVVQWILIETYNVLTPLDFLCLPTTTTTTTTTTNRRRRRGRHHHPRTTHGQRHAAGPTPSVTGVVPILDVGVAPHPLVHSTQFFREPT